GKYIDTPLCCSVRIAQQKYKHPQPVVPPKAGDIFLIAMSPCQGEGVEEVSPFPLPTDYNHLPSVTKSLLTIQLLGNVLSLVPFSLL
ncbi:MAG TPA: hypothetical protein VMC85_14800, partial [Desulfomonilaceae bacterium]|nr:hypothetical protein [Desulfomonilaceae bacterium]